MFILEVKNKLVVVVIEYSDFNLLLIKEFKVKFEQIKVVVEGVVKILVEQVLVNLVIVFDDVYKSIVFIIVEIDSKLFEQINLILYY